jgi:hypothetical protein
MKPTTTTMMMMMTTTMMTSKPERIIARSKDPPEQSQEASAGASGWHSAFDVALGIVEQALMQRKEKTAHEKFKSRPGASDAGTVARRHTKL